MSAETDIFNFRLGKMYARNSDILHLITCYKFPTDYPDKYVIRVMKVHSGGFTEFTGLVLTVDTEEEMHNSIPELFTWMPRYEQDDPKILGVYM